MWKGDQADWPAGGTACGVAKVVLRSLLTKLGGVGGNVTIVPETGGGDGDRAGSMSVRLFFKHRGLGSSSDDDAAAAQNTGQPSASASANEEAFQVGATKAAAQAMHGGARNDARRLVQEPFREEFDVLGEKRSGGPGRSAIDDGTAAHRDDPDTVKVTSRRASLSTAEENPQRPGGALGGGKRPQVSSTSSLGGERGLRVHVERAMRLGVVASAAAASGDVEVGVGGNACSPRAALLPSTYVTFRWEEEGKPPLRSPLLLPPVLSRPSGGAGVTDGEEENWQVSFFLYSVHVVRY